MKEFISETVCVRACVFMHASEYAVVFFFIVCGFMSQSTAILMPRWSVPISTLFFLDKLHKADNQYFVLYFHLLLTPLFESAEGGEYPSKHVNLGYYRPSSITPSKWSFPGGPIVARNLMLAGAVEINP